MTPHEMLALFDLDERRQATVPGMRREETAGVVRLIHVAEPQARNFIAYSLLDAKTAEAAIAAQVADFRALARTVEWKRYAHDQPADLDKRLTAHGFAVGDEDTILVLDLGQAPQRLIERVPQNVRRVGEGEGLARAQRVLEEVWGKDFGWFAPRMQRLIAAGYATLYLAELEGEPAATGWTFFTPGSRFAGMWGGSTRVAFRGRGLYGQLLAARAQEARARDRAFLTIDAGAMSRPIVERYGFQVLTEAREYVWSPDAG